MLPEVVSEKLKALPVQPGVYIFKDKKGEVLYVGKAKSLRSRVRSYFQSGGSDNRSFIPVLIRTIGDLDTIVASSEKEATILENTLIKEHRPRYNVKLRDDKEYLSLKLNVTHAWPRLDVVRRPAADGAEYFGPYHSATAARRTLHLINKHFQLRTCGDLELVSRRRPCLQYQIKRCPAPCVHEVDPAWYAEQVRTVSMFLEGRHDELTKVLQEKMRTAAADLRFELAVVYRDQLRALEKVRESQRVVTPEMIDQDVIGLYREGDLVEIAALYVRGGKLADVGTFAIKHAEIPDDEIVAAFIAQHYGRTVEGDEALDQGPLAIPIPKEIVVPCLPEGHVGIAEWLSDRAKTKIALLFPKRGPRAHLLSMANDNARHSFLEKQRVSDSVHERLGQLQERLRLPTLPHRIECCDISHLGGGDTVGAVVAMLDGLPDKKHYRTFHVRTVAVADGNSPASPERGPNLRNAGDDYAAMYEVLARRFRRGANAEAESESNEWELPDLFVVDGGRGQLGVALAAARDLGLHNLPIVALAKEKENVMGETLVDRVYLPGQKNPIPLKTHSASLFFLARLRDEAHRFSNRAREKLGKARRFHSALDDVRGIGPKTKKALLKALGSVAAIERADDAALLAVAGVTKRHVDALRRVFPGPAAPANPPGELPTKGASAN
jgi:excinuclease ABC subunit C